MNDLQWYDFMRLSTATITLTAIVIFTMRIWAKRKLYTNMMRDSIWLSYAFHILLIIIMLETVIQDEDYGYRIPIGFFVSLIALRVSYNTNKVLKEVQTFQDPE